MIAIIALAFTSSSQFRFDGGAIDDLVSEVHRQLGNSVVAGLYEPDAVPAFKCESSLKAVAKKLSSVAPYELVSCRTCLAITPTLLPSYVDSFHGTSVYAKARRAPRIRPLTITDGFVDGSTNNGEVVRCVSLISYDWGAPLTQHWLYGKYGLLFSLAHARRSDVLDAVAKCVGAKEVETNTLITLDFSPIQWRKRFAACVADPTDEYKDTSYASALVGKLTNEMTAAMFDSVSDEFLINCFNNPDQYFAVPIVPQSLVAKLANRRLAEIVAMCDREPINSSSVGQSISGLLEQADLRKPMHIEYRAAAWVGLGLGRKDGPGQVLL